MKAVSIKEIKQELVNYSPSDLRELCLKLARFKKENKELLSYMLFESTDEANYIENIRKELDEQFESINRKSTYLIKKSFRKILRLISKYSRYSKKKETEVELLIYFCSKLIEFKPSIRRNSGLMNLFLHQMEVIRKKIPELHEDLQFDLGEQLKSITLPG